MYGEEVKFQTPLNQTGCDRSICVLYVRVDLNSIHLQLFLRIQLAFTIVCEVLFNTNSTFHLLIP